LQLLEGETGGQRRRGLPACAAARTWPRLPSCPPCAHAIIISANPAAAAGRQGEQSMRMQPREVGSWREERGCERVARLADHACNALHRLQMPAPSQARP
jgi:hypothetical protein